MHGAATTSSDMPSTAPEPDEITVVRKKIDKKKVCLFILRLSTYSYEIEKIYGDIFIITISFAKNIGTYFDIDQCFSKAIICCKS
jgi:hypothetical protein